MCMCTYTQMLSMNLSRVVQAWIESLATELRRLASGSIRELMIIYIFVKPINVCFFQITYVVSKEGSETPNCAAAHTHLLCGTQSHKKRKLLLRIYDNEALMVCIVLSATDDDEGPCGSAYKLSATTNTTTTRRQRGYSSH